MKKYYSIYLLRLSLLMLVAMIFHSCASDEKKTGGTAPVTDVDISFIADRDSITIAQKAKKLDKKFNRLKKLTGFNGTVLYAEKGRVVFKKAYGYKDVRHKRDSLTTHDAFQLASVSKMFSAMAIMILKNDGLIDYDEDIRLYLPEFPYEGVTLRLLMNHRSGLPRYMSLALDKWENKKIPMNNDDMLDLFIKYPPDTYFRPDKGFHYCNTNYALLANIVEEVSGSHFEDFVAERIFKPLGMNDSFVFNMRGDSAVGLYINKGVPGFYRRRWRWRKMENDYLNGVMGDKNIYTSVEDLYKYDRALDNFTLVPKEVVSEAFKPGSPKYWKRRNNYGFGWRIKGGMDSTVYHFGWWKGFRTFYIREMKHHKTLIVLTNKEKGPGSANFWNIIKSDTLPLGPLSDLPLN
ncbi:MAG: beta-lactamase family protein [Chlorobi bacterium]|nr:beta-lactamase family protein [Chlorobiota bacterium]